MLFAVARGEDSHGTWEIRGRVVDEQGNPVEEFVAATFWSSNGNLWDENGDSIQTGGDGERKTWWEEEGAIVPCPRYLATRLAGGAFTVKIEENSQASVFATDATRRRGGLVSVQKIAADKPVTIALHPLTRVTGKVFCPEANRTPGETMAVVHPPRDVKGSLQFTQCGSLKGEFSFLLPPGCYDLDISSSKPNARMPKPRERQTIDAPVDMPKNRSGIRVEVPVGHGHLDVGTLNVVLEESLERHAYPRLYGKRAPELSITDARGAPKSVKLADYRGKWVLLDFWGLTCVPCIEEGLPKLARFYEEHAADRDRFEILAICGNWNQEAKTIQEFERLVAPIVEKVWGGKQLPFPVLIDGDEQTFESYGVEGVPVVLLIDPEGNVVKDGDETMLAKKLKEKAS